MYILLCGSGVGCSVQSHHIENLPLLQTKIPNKEIVYTISDNIQGWADSIGILISSYHTQSSEKEFDKYINKKIVFNYKDIRKKGSYLSSSIGKAPGPVPLKNTHIKIRHILEESIRKNQKKLFSIQCHDIVCHISDAVLSGAV